jgi:tRNA A-37 threonylcarbamoyl transferase component Bud32
MATLEVRIKYETPMSRACFWGLTLLSPVWGIFPILVLLYNHVCAGSVTYLSVVSLAGFGAGIFPLFIIGLYLWFFFRDNQLVLSQQGICFPSSLLSLIMRRNRPWYKLQSVEVVGLFSASNNYRNCRLLLHYPRDVINLNLHNLPANDVEQLLLALETFGGAAGGQDAVGDLKRLVKSELNVKGIKSYTNLWDDELRYRYAATTFIPLAPGSTLQDGQIKVLRQLGFGGLSAIYLVQCQSRELAILKESVLPADVDDQLRAKAEEQFKREARILSGLKHPRLARVLDHFVERGHYLLLEYIHGQDLRQYVNEKGKMAERAVLAVAVQIADILNYLHTREPAIVHRDLTPENLIISDKSKVMLIDFGAANEFLHTATGTLVGKHAYMAPEQLKGRAHTQSDLYSLGCTMHFLLTAADPTPLVASHPAALNPAVLPDTDALVFQLTQFNLEARPQTASETASRLKSLLKGELS